MDSFDSTVPVHLSGMNGENCLHQRNVPREVTGNDDNDCRDSNGDDAGRLSRDDPKLSLMEELLLIVMDPRGFVSIWNDHVSRALRGCMLVELWMSEPSCLLREIFSGKIELEPAGIRRKCLSRRVVVVKNSIPTDDCILNEALKLIKSSEPMTVPDWISYLCGETWNPLKLKFHMRMVRDRLFKDLVERGILSAVKTNYWFMDVKTHPIKDFGVMKQLVAKVKDALLEHYSNDIRRMDRRTLTLLIMTHYSGGIENCLSGLSSETERLAMKRMQDIESTDFEAESKKDDGCDLHWAVYAALNDPYIVI